MPVLSRKKSALADRSDGQLGGEVGDARTALRELPRQHRQFVDLAHAAVDGTRDIAKGRLALGLDDMLATQQGPLDPMGGLRVAFTDFAMLATVAGVDLAEAWHEAVARAEARGAFSALSKAEYDVQVAGLEKTVADGEQELERRRVRGELERVQAELVALGDGETEAA
jgi:hypothetical protein